MGLKFGFLALITLCLTSCFEASSTNKDSKRNTKTAVKETPYNYQPKAPTQQELACATETCGAASKLPFFSAQPKEEDRALFKQNLESSLKQYVELSVRYAGIKNKVVSDFATMQLDKISDSYLALVNYLYFSGFSKQISHSISQTNFGIKVDVRILREQLTKSGVSDPKIINWVIQVASTLYESYAFSTNYYLSQFPLEIFVQKQYPGRETLDGIAMEAEKLLSIQENVNETFPILKTRSAGPIAIFKKAMRKEPLAPDEKQELISQRMTLLSLKEMLPNGRWRSVMLERPVQIQNLVAELIKKSQASKLLKSNITINSSEAQNSFFMCTYYLLSHIASSPTPEQNLNFSNLMQSLKADAKNTIASSSYTAPHVLAAIDKINIVLPATKQQTTVALSRALRNEITTGNSGVESLTNLDIRNQEDKELVVLLLASQYADEEDDDSALSHVKEFCYENAAPQISDAAYASYQLVNVGWRSVLYPHYGYGIASHELAHVISRLDEQSSKPVFSRVKSCLKENQNNSENFIEEDFADTFAVQMIKNKRQASHSNYSCLLLSQNDSAEYSDLQMSTREDAVHSSSFYRLISVGTEIGGLGPSCQVAKQSAPKGQLVRNCWGR